jgi:hypothetical protein
LVKRKKKSSSSKLSFEKKIDKQIRHLQQSVLLPSEIKEIKDLKKRIEDLEEDVFYED